jgi:hypothetical protein
MYQSDRGGYRKKESVFGMFWHSCLGKIIVTGTVLVILMVIAYVTCPSEKYMREEMIDDIRQCIERPDSIQTDWIDDAIANVGYIFTEADSTVNVELLNNFKRNNRLVYYNHSLFSTMYVYNNFRIDGIRCGIGIFGLVIPTINFNDLLLREGPMRDDYNKHPTEVDTDNYYFGETPDLIFKEENYY